ncbi:MAG: sugar phosphate isomerase/epimerase, partial [Planctomycetales bacterium]|nr:sugar phosphate isomerase/epimerase [Planctomycetales bacterium]
MPRLSCSQLSTFRWSFEEDLYYYKLSGFEAIGLWRRKLLDFGLERAIELLAESGLTVSNLTWAGGFTGVDGRSFQESVHDARGALHLASAVGAQCLLVYAGGRNCHTLRHAQRLLCTALDELLPLAEQLNVPLAIKPTHPACSGEWSFLTTLEDTARVLESRPSRCLKMAFDTYHFPLHGEGLRVLEQLIPHIALVQLADAHTPHGIDLDRCPLGEGEVPVTQLVHALLRFGYDEYFDAELMGQD